MAVIAEPGLMPEAITSLLGDGDIAISTVPLSSVLTFDVDDNNGVTLDGYEWRVYIDDPNEGKIGTIELAGEEVSSSSIHQVNIPPWAGSKINLQILANGFEESLNKLTIESGERFRIAVQLILETNL